MTDADSLADFDIDPAWASYEGYQYVPGRVFEQLCLALPPDEQTGPVHPPEPAGVPFNEWEMAKRFPRLVAKYRYKESDWISEKIRKEKAAKDWEEGRRLAELMIESGIISCTGLIPPARIVRNVLRTGKSPDPKRRFSWEPFELDEGHFWQAVTHLENKSSSDKTLRSQSDHPAFKLDVHAANAMTYSDWLQSLKNRGLA